MLCLSRLVWRKDRGWKGAYYFRWLLCRGCTIQVLQCFTSACCPKWGLFYWVQTTWIFFLFVGTLLSIALTTTRMALFKKFNIYWDVSQFWSVYPVRSFLPYKFIFFFCDANVTSLEWKKYNCSNFLCVGNENQEFLPLSILVAR